MNQEIEYIKYLQNSDAISQLTLLSVKREINQVTKELVPDNTIARSILHFSISDSTHRISLTFRKNISIEELALTFGPLEIHYNPRDDFSTVRFAILTSSAAQIEFVVRNKLKETSTGKFQTVDPKGKIIIADTGTPLETLSLKYI